MFRIAAVAAIRSRRRRRKSLEVEAVIAERDRVTARREVREVAPSGQNPLSRDGKSSPKPQQNQGQSTNTSMAESRQRAREEHSAQRCAYIRCLKPTLRATDGLQT